jgi:hypothetical protein
MNESDIASDAILSSRWKSRNDGAAEYSQEGQGEGEGAARAHAVRTIEGDSAWLWWGC